MSKVNRSLSSLVLIAVAGVGGWYAFSRARAAGPPNGPGGPGGGPPVMPVVATSASKRDVPVFLDGLGTVQAFNTVAIRTQVDGQIVKIGFTEGQPVHKGDLLVKIDPQPFEANLEQAQAKKKQDEAKLLQDQAHVKQDEAKIKQDQAKINQDIAKKALDQADLENARLTLVRDQNAVKANAVTQQSVDDQQTKVKEEEATILADDAAIEADRAQVQADEAAVQADQAGIEADQAGVAADDASARFFQTQLAYTTIVSPIDGISGIRQVDVGNIVHTTDANGIVVVTQVQPISMIFTLRQQDFYLIHERMNAAKLPVVAMDPNPSGIGEMSRGVLDLIDNQIDPNTGTIKLKATFSNEDRKLWPGGFVNARLIAETRKDATVVAAPAVQQGPDSSYHVFVIKADDTVELRTIKFDRIQDGEAIITSGLEPGEQVVLSGQDRLKNGTHVAVSQPKTGAGAKGHGPEKSGN